MKHSFLFIGDIWTNENADSFSTVTAHYIDEETATLKTKTLDCSDFEKAHTGDMIEEEWTRVENKFNLKNKIPAITADSAQNNIKAARQKGIARIPCSPHKYNTCIGTALDQFEELKDLRNKVAEIVTHVHK